MRKTRIQLLLLLSVQMPKAWESFAKIGDPNYVYMPQRKNFTREHRNIMVFGETTRNEERHNRELIDKHFEYMSYRDTFELMMATAKRNNRESPEDLLYVKWDRFVPVPF